MSYIDLVILAGFGASTDDESAGTFDRHDDSLVLVIREYVTSDSVFFPSERIASVPTSPDIVPTTLIGSRISVTRHSPERGQSFDVVRIRDLDLGLLPLETLSESLIFDRTDRPRS